MNRTDLITEVIKHLPGQHDQMRHAGMEHATTERAAQDIRVNGIKPGSYVIDTDYYHGAYHTAHHEAVLENIITEEGRLTPNTLVYIADLDLNRQQVKRTMDPDLEFEDPVSFITKKPIPPLLQSL